MRNKARPRRADVDPAHLSGNRQLHFAHHSTNVLATNEGGHVEANPDPEGRSVRALLSRAPGGPETLELTDLPEPEPGPGELLVRVKACAINYPDVLIIEDKYQFKPTRPFAPGGEIAGIVDAVGEGVSGWSEGDRVIAMIGHGGLAEKVLVQAAMALPLPPDRGFEEGSALILTYATSIHALLDRGRLKPGETLLVLGAAGGVGLAAVELGRAYGARVVAAVSSEEKAQAARSAGADAVLVYPRGPFDKDQSKALAQQLKEAVGPTGADLIYDPVGGDYAEPALRAIAWEGRYLVVGFPAGIPKLPLNLTLLKSCDVCGVFWGAFAARDPEANAAHIRTLFRLWSEGRIAPKVSATWPLERGGEAIAHMAARKAVGKLVVTLGD
jgi:NADPH:quinone reductase-like Zn-dependent oxidoreductase